MISVWLENSNAHTWSKSSLTTCYMTIVQIPSHITHCAPLVLVADFHTAFTITSSSHQTNVTLSASCMFKAVTIQLMVQKKFNMLDISYVKSQADKPLQHLQNVGSREQQEGWKNSQSVSVHCHHTPYCQGICLQCLAQMQHFPVPVLLYTCICIIIIIQP